MAQTQLIHNIWVLAGKISDYDLCRLDSLPDIAQNRLARIEFVSSLDLEAELFHRWLDPVLIDGY